MASTLAGSNRFNTSRQSPRNNRHGFRLNATCHPSSFTNQTFVGFDCVSARLATHGRFDSFGVRSTAAARLTLSVFVAAQSHGCLAHVVIACNLADWQPRTANFLGGCRIHRFNTGAVFFLRFHVAIGFQCLRSNILAASRRTFAFAFFQSGFCGPFGPSGSCPSFQWCSRHNVIRLACSNSNWGWLQ